MGVFAAPASSPPGIASEPRLMRREAALLALVVALQLVLPSVHALAQRDQAALPVEVALRHTSDAPALSAGGAARHHAEDCPQCQAFAQARSQTVPTHGAVPAPAFLERAALLASPEQLLPAAPALGSGSPRSPPASHVLS
jgi:hypothetical protein